MNFTERSLRIFKYAEKEAERTNKMVYPVHLLLGMLLEKTGVCAELSINYPNIRDILNKRVKELYSTQDEKGINHAPFTTTISLSTQQVLEIANSRMKRFNQVYLNEGHLVDAIFRSNDPSTMAIIGNMDVSRILEIVSYPRDMVASLREYSFPHIPTSTIIFRKVEQSDATSLKSFVQREFGSGWLEAIEMGFLQENIPIFIAVEEQEIVGFACFDVVRRKKGLFGPMGTSLTNRVQGIGYTLLHLCLNEMKKIGYEYAVIGEAGPLEFYEKACGAIAIPKHLKNKKE
ncbi:GNAT family N-acetyltransferase [Lysinibacillus piscis]|uniref:Acetyltransferase n=1 Tax=Lysinibacillus piscis TaxID=2518931 RepID=A0ABQ5NNN3_9BACI|nr:GNAT family N-acetyltransferase [Lysinibacillus sp. KH24]GLC89924.1 acetyltransferase [Lysinibacillus sp. KH24]